jgi:hypothetical protein
MADRLMSRRRGKRLKKCPWATGFTLLFIPWTMTAVDERKFHGLDNKPKVRRRKQPMDQTFFHQPCNTLLFK